MVAKVNRLKAACVFTIGVLFTLLSFCANAQTPNILIDDETETFVCNIVRPIFKVAGIRFDKNKVHLLSDSSLNAFVSDGNHLFVHTGTLMAAKNPNEISGILAHETGHIAGGHILRQKLKIQNLQTLAAVSLVAAGAFGVASGRGDAALAVALGSQGSLLNSLIAYQLGEERSADESAVKYLKALGQSPEGLRNFMKTIQKTNRLSGYEEVDYFRTHPMSAERLSFFQNSIQKNGGSTKSAYDEDFLFVQAKLTAFLLPIDRVLKKYPATDKSAPAKYAHSIVKFRQKKFNEAVLLVDELIAQFPKNPYFLQLKGQFLFESGKIEPALESYQKALALKPDSAETTILYATAAFESKNKAHLLQDVINRLVKLQNEHERAAVWQLLSRAYFEKGQLAESFDALARYNFAIGNIELAQRQVKKALESNPSASLKLRLSDLERQIKLEKEQN